MKSLKDLHALAKELAQRQKADAEREAIRQETERRVQAENNLFQRAAGAVKPIRHPQRVPLAREPAPPIPVQQQLDEQRVLLEAISDEFDATTLLDVDDALSFRRPGIGTDVTRKLRKGHWSIQRALDLHGLRTDDARAALTAFIRDACQQGIRCVRIVHGKGLGSPGKAPVLKHKVHGWLVQKSEILAFVQARPAEGGAGALVVLLQPTPAAR